MQLIDMRHLYRLQLLIFVGLVLYVYVQCQTICKKDQYTVVKPDGSKTCLNCDTCHAGRGLDPPCGSHIPYPPKIDCVTCPDGKFSDKLDSAPCHSCQRCADHEVEAAPCTNQSDRICNGTCEAGYFYSKKDSTHSCKKCSYCCLDGKDEEILECANQDLEASKQHCHPRPDRDCNPDSSVISPTTQKTGNDTSTDGSSITGDVVGGVFGGVSFIVTIGIALYCLCVLRRKKAAEVADAQQSSKVEEGNGKASHISPYASEGPQVSTANTQVSFTVPADTNMEPQVILEHEKSALGTVERQDVIDSVSAVNVYTANEQANQNATHRNNASEPDFASVNLVATEDNTGDKKSGALPVINEVARPAEEEPAVKDEAAASDLKDNTSGGPKRRLSRQFSRDSQRSGDADGESGRRRRSPSASSFTETIKRKLSVNKDDPLLPNEEQDTDGSQEAIKIKVEPSSQEIKEGLKVELVFKCAARGNGKLTYQWYKDGTELKGKDEGSLVLESVALPDFGWYNCVAVCKDSRESVKSLLVLLDVLPRDGTKYKCLKKIDINTQDRIEGLLTQKSYGSGGWREVAFKYGMDQLRIKSLENDSEAGKKTLEYLGARNPDLAVYDFCKTLKEHNIRRLDIVKELLGHLSVPSSSKAYV